MGDDLIKYKACDDLLEEISKQLADLPVEELSKAETNIFRLLCEADYMCAAYVGDVLAAKIV